jgi:hypothetical protein
VGGGWNEVVSLATDLGAAVDTRSTRRESAAVLADAFPATQGTTTMLARRADASIFGAGEPTEEDVREYWTIVDGSLKEMTSGMGFWRRQQARFSPRSLLADARAAMNAGKGASLRGGRASLPAVSGFIAARRRRASGSAGAPPVQQGPVQQGPNQQGPNQQGPNQQGPGQQ